MDESAEGWSATPLDVQERLRALREEDATAALATVTAVQGSAYRRPGAKMVLTPEGDQLGGITAGCLEGPVASLAEDVYASGQPVLERFDLVDDDEWGLGLGCNGVIDVFVEPVDDGWDAALAVLADRDPVGVATVVESDAGDVPAGARATLTGDGTVDRPSERAGLPDGVLDDVRDELAVVGDRGDTEVTTVEAEGGAVDVALDGVQPPPELLVFGGQPDTLPVARLARQVGFRVTVATARGARADPGRFPPASEVVAAHPTELAELVDGDTYVVVMTHNLLDDELALSTLAETEVPYVGLMGPRDRFEQLRDDLAADGEALPDGFLDRIATPVGLDLGGGSPPEIAISIVSEVVAVAHDRDGRRLREREGPIHGERTPVEED